MRSEELSRVIDAFGPSDDQKRRMLEGIIRHSPAKARRRGGLAKAAVIAAAVSLFSGTAVAVSHTEWFTQMFGDSIYLIEDQILYPMESAADDRFRLTLEGVLSDAYGCIAIVSVEALKEQLIPELEQMASRLHIRPLQSDIRSNRTTVVELDHFSEKRKKRFMVEFRSVDGPLTGDLEIGLMTDTSRLALSAPAVGTIRTIAIELDESRYAAADYVPRTVSISPLSITVRGYERTVGHEVPVPDVTLHFANGKTLDFFKETGFSGSRFPEDGTTTVSAQFERIIDLDQLRSITVDGTAYPAGDSGTR
jgi:hypothetical protein